VEALKKEIEELNSEVLKINSFKENRTMSMDILREFTTVLPKTVWLTRAKITETTIDMEGYAGTATELLQKLEASKYFKKVEFASPTFRDTRLNMDRFIIKMEIEGKGKDEVKGFKNEKK
jgi:general secretion pathway protein L